MEVRYLDTPLMCRSANNVVDFNAYRQERVIRALPTRTGGESLPTLNLGEEDEPTLFQRCGMVLDAVASLALSVAAVTVLFVMIL